MSSSSSRPRSQALESMANTPAAAILSPLSEASSPDDESRQQPSPSTRSSTYRPFDPVGLFSQSRRRRPPSRLLSSRDASRANSDATGSSASANAVASSSSPQGLFNPHAAEFVPGAKMPPKRKASSSARPGKSILVTPRSNSSQSAVSDHPIIRAEEIFGREPRARTSSAAFETTVDDDDHSEIFDLDMHDELDIFQDRQDALAQQRERLQDALSLIRTRVPLTSEKSRRSFHCSSAVLFSLDQTASATEGSSGSTRLHYLPLQSVGGRRDVINKESILAIVPSYRERIDGTSMGATPSKAVWPYDELPVEIFDLITDHLSRDDVESMRLVSKEFEKKVSRTLFHTSVVPFNTELYDMVDEDTRAVSRVARINSRYKGKGKARAQDHPNQLEGLPTGLHWRNAKEDAEGKVYKGHGLRVFQGFGPHIRRFGLSFEVAEGQLARTPVKKELDHVESYYGSYDWPHHQYTRFAGLAGLERTADDTMRMKSAFSNLRKVQDLALSIDSGLGWLNGPDKSIRAQIFDRPSPVFGSSWDVPDRQMQEARDFWNAIESSTVPGRLTHLMLRSLPQVPAPSDLPGLHGTRYADPQLWSTIGADKVLPSHGTESSLDDLRYGVLYTCSINSESGQTPVPAYDESSLVPAELRKEQKEWLLETEWAQRAFLECYVLAIMDNPMVFSNVKTLKLAKISSGFLPLLARSTFWDALPGLSDVTAHVKPDWRIVERDNAGYAEVCNQNPSEAARLFYKVILRDRICLRPSITKLDIGWIGGGEHAEGMFARNTNILPAPITPLELADARHTNGSLVFNFVEHLTLTNCWLTPPVLEELITNHVSKPLRKLTLESVSLTSHPRFPANGQPAPAVGLVQMPPPGAAQGQQTGLLNLVNQNQNVQAQQQWPPQWSNLANQNQNGHGQAPQQIQQMQFAAMQNLHIPAPPPGWALPPGFANAVQQQGMNPQQVAQAHQQMFQQNGIFPPAHLAPAAITINLQAHLTPPSHWSEGHREGSWPELLNKISCGTIFTDYLPRPAPWEEQLPPRKETNLRTIEFKSCGYVKLINNTSFDQTAITSTRLEIGLPTFSRERHAALTPAMMTTTDRYIGRIMQFMPQRELDALLFAWGMTEGWADHARAEEAEYDGMARGGTGRFSGRIDQGMALVHALAASGA